jgi:UDP-glucuronate 4-epimerase
MVSQFESRKMAVTGCAGFIGSKTTEFLLEQGHHVVGIDALIDDLYPNSFKNQRLARFDSHPNFTFVQANLASGDFVTKLDGADTVIHFAAMAGLTKSWTHPEAYILNNVDATRRLVDAVIQVQPSFFVHASTSSVYGGHAVGDETLPLNPISPYGETKVEAEMIVGENLNAHGIGYTVLRYFSVFGPRQRPDMAYSKFCQALIRDEVIHVTGDGSQRRSNTFIDDAAHAALLAANARLDGEVFNIAGNESITLLDAIDILADELGVTPRLEFIPTALGDQTETAGDASKAHKMLRWSPSVSINEGLKRQARAARDDFLGIVP